MTPVLQVRDLAVDFGDVPAVRGVGFDLSRGEVLGIVGESGSGKSATALAVLGLLPRSARVGGSVLLDGTELLGAPERTLDSLRGNRIAMVFQDPLSAFTPVYRIGDQITEAIRAHQDVSKDAARRRAVELLDLVGIPEPRVRAEAFPHEFSGGMRQRAMIAMAVANDPDVILADEPTTALDVTIQAQILDVLRTAQRETGAAMVLVSHDLGVIAGTADRVAVMYAGRIVETAPVDDLFARPVMPYTLGLIGAVPRLDGATPAAGPGGGPGPEGGPGDGSEAIRSAEPGSPGPVPVPIPGAPPVLVPIPGTPPAMDALPPGCPFAPRCPLAEDVCREAEPALSAAVVPSHLAACVRSDEIAARRLGPTDVFPVPEPASAPASTREEAQAGPALRVRGLVRSFPLYKGTVFKRRTGTVHAVDGVELDIRRGETLGLVGESGSGKSTTLYEILGLQAPERGEVEILGVSTSRLARREAQRLRGQVQIVFQDPLAGLDPRMPVGEIVAEPLRAQGADRAAIARRIPGLLRLVGLDAAHADRFPHEFSGGQRQRICIARALSVEPRLLVLDEPVSALDVSIQAGILNLLQALKHQLGLAYLFVSHDLSVVRHIADRVSVMYLGRTVEAGSVAEVFTAPRHPYTQALLSAVPLPDPPRERARERILLAGDPPSPTRREDGCRFRGRCPVFAGLGREEAHRCESVVPPLLSHGADHVAACHYPRVREVV
ncbi:ABC transporter ATP-binding protein [Streptomyces sp. NBC_01497]|uniref:ABC transporter ATP-binding protein n=1 Tax=Streptomyces sp. NBC_01497 TaxID=2903885 RepID=UPI002E37FEA6|nr:ABC transporter ATP-binding protein [Streptomyces sp. NBC_01497]